MNPEMKKLFTTPPEFELRCDAFVAEVTDKVVGKHPDFDFDVENKTKYELLKVHPHVIDKLKQVGSGQATIKRTQQLDKESAHLHAASVLVFGAEGEETINLLERIADEVDEIAEKHGGFGHKKVFDDDIPYYDQSPSVYMVYLFW